MNDPNFQRSNKQPDQEASPKPEIIDSDNPLTEAVFEKRPRGLSVWQFLSENGISKDEARLLLEGCPRLKDPQT